MNVSDLLDARRYLSHIGVWPGPRQMGVERWLQNFDTDVDTEIALALLESYVHINEEQIAYSVCSTVRSLSTRAEFGTAKDRQANWGEFVEKAVISFPLGGPGDSTASGFIFARIASQLGVPDSRIFDSEHLVPWLAKAESPHPVIFLDDLAASGTQFTRNWERKYLSERGELSMASLANQGALTNVYYVPVVSTSAAKMKIETKCGVSVLPAYLLDEDYSAVAKDTRLVPTNLREVLPEFIERHGLRTGKADSGNAGFGHLGLALSFHHGSPNNTLPVLQWGTPTPNWRPLVSEGI